MEALIAWCGFVGGWLLVAGPVHQAAIELREEALEESAYASVRESMPPREPTSPWWWLIPPVYFVLARRRGHRQRNAAFAALDPEQRGQLVDFASKAQGWLTVGMGALLIATKETWELREAYEWPTWAFWILVVAMAVLALGNTAVRTRRAEQMRDAAARPRT